MVVGLPGAGLSTVFYLLLVGVMPLRALWRQATGRPLPPGEWRRIGRQWAIAGGILAVLAAMGYALPLLLDVAGSPSGGPASEGDTGPASLFVTIAGLGILVALITLGVLLAVIELLALVSARSGVPTSQPASHRPAHRGPPEVLRSPSGGPRDRPPGSTGGSSGAPAGSGRWTGSKS